MVHVASGKGDGGEQWVPAQDQTPSRAPGCTSSRERCNGPKPRLLAYKPGQLYHAGSIRTCMHGTVRLSPPLGTRQAGCKVRPAWQYSNYCRPLVPSPALLRRLVQDEERGRRERSILVGRRRCRLKACSTSFPVFLKVASDGWVFLAAQLFLPALFFLRVGGFEGGGLAAVEVQGCAFEEGDVLRDEDVLDA